MLTRPLSKPNRRNTKNNQSPNRVPRKDSGYRHIRYKAKIKMSKLGKSFRETGNLRKRAAIVAEIIKYSKVAGKIGGIKIPKLVFAELRKGRKYFSLRKQSLGIKLSDVRRILRNASDVSPNVDAIYLLLGREKVSLAELHEILDKLWGRK